MRQYIFLILISLLALTACDPSSGACYEVRNDSDSIVEIKLKTGVIYETHKTDTTLCSSSVNDSVVRLSHNEYMAVIYGALSNRAPEHTPLWKDIISISAGSHIIPEEKWNSEDKWQSDKSGGHVFSFGEDWHYVLSVNKGMVQ